ncbi:MAG TPA: TonB-dependent receptor [Terriglobales bacterium]|jgi:hypothetical protein|nr:TonB-dependent receptor [Terriglobales bacterium]
MLKAILFRKVYVLVSVVLFASAATLVLAQQINVAQVAGQITDKTGAVIPGASVRMTEVERGVAHTAVTDTGGRYVMPGLPVGAYRLQVQKDSFKTFVQDGIVLQVNDHAMLNIVLEAGAVSQVVEVIGGASTIQTEDASVSNVIESKPIAELPLNGRYATQLVITSGASMMAPGGDETGSKSFYSSVTISVAGGQANATNYLLDGGDNNDTFSNVNLPFPFPDALQEFSVETSSLPAKNGLHPGGVVNLVTKSGTNNLHGNAFEFYRDGVFNAKQYAFTPSGTKQDNLLRNQYGGTIGGKILTDKLFFFAGYQGTRQHASAPASTHTFTPAALAGDFTTLAGAGCQSNSKTKTLAAPFAGNKVNPGLFDPAAVKLVTNYIPVSSDPCGLLSYTIPLIDNEDEIVGRMDYVFNSKHSLYGRYLIDDFRAPAPFSPTNLLLTANPGNLERAQSFTLGDNYSFSSNLMNSAHLTLTRRRDNRGVDPRDINPTTLGSNMFVAIPNFLLLSVNSYFNVGCGTCAPGHFNVNTLSATDDVDWIRGRHHFSFGVTAIRTQNNTLTGYDENGTFTFQGSVSGDGLADFLMGTYNGGGGLGFTQSRAQKVNYRETIPGLYAQDTIRLSNRLTLNVGLRWEPNLWPTDTLHRGSIFNTQAFLNNQHSGVYPSAPAGMLFFGDPGVPAAFTNNHMLNFAPRFGIAFDPFGDGKQSIRAGYGIFYDSSMVWYSQRLTSNPPVVNQIDLQNKCGTFSNPWLNYSIANGCGVAGANQNPFPGGTISFPGNSFWVALPQNMRPMYMQQWDFSFQRQFDRDWVMSLSYLGSRSLHVPLSYDFNAPQVTPAACAAVGTCTAGNENARRYLTLLAGGAAAPQNPTAIGTLDLGFDKGYANYNGFLASLQHRFTKGISLQANYTWSKCMSTGDFNGDLRGSYFQNQTNPNADYAPCNFDIKHIYNTTLVAQSPFTGGGLRNSLLGGWQFSSTIRATSGWPINVTDGSDRSLTGEGNDRPNIVPGQPLYIKHFVPCGANWCYQWLNPAAFSVPTAAPGAFGNVGRDFVYSPGVFNFDAAVSRRFKVHEQTQFELRFEAFNAINHFNASIGGPGTTAGLNSANFGRQTAAGTPGFLPSVYDPRILQFSTKLSW